MVATKYFTLVGKTPTNKVWEIIFGDYSKREVIEEKINCKECESWYTGYKILTTDESQESITNAVQVLNN